MSKRSNGEGTIVKLGNGKFRAALYVPQPDGRKKRKYHVTRTQREAREWLVEKQREIKAGWIEPDVHWTLLDWLRYWITHYALVRIRTSTRMNYEGYLKHIERHSVAEKSLSTLKADDLQQFVIYLQTAGHLDTAEKQLSTKTIRNILTMLHSALQQAVRCQLILRNPAEYVQLPRVQQPQVMSLSEVEVQRLYDEIENDELQIAFLLMAFAGLRLGEVCALRHSDVHCDGSICFISVSHSLNRVQNFGAKTGEARTMLQLQETKTRKGERVVPLVGEVAKAVRQHISNQLNTASKSYGAYADDPFLVSNEVGSFVDPSTVRRKLKRYATQAGIEDFHPHLLRHTFASQAVKNGMPLPYLSDILGHESTAFTSKVYVTLDLEGRAEAMENMKKLINLTLRDRGSSTVRKELV